MLHQTFAPHDLLVIAILIGLEGVLSLDNALVLGMLARRLPKTLQTRALTYGLVGAVVFRFAAVAMAAALLRWRVAKLLGGAYLIYIAVKHLLNPAKHPTDANEDAATGEVDYRGDYRGDTRGDSRAFWTTVGMIELTDIAFAVDSILAAIALVGAAPAGATVHPKLWVVMVGGIAGVVLMRFAAVIFIRLLERFPRFETSAYLLVLTIGLKMLLDWALNAPPHTNRIDFENIYSPAFWVFWTLMAASVVFGFLPTRASPVAASVQKDG